jgi:ParB-like chromosome segregation protein Spo0J
MDKIQLTNSVTIPLSKIEPNSGQIAGVPKNPRFIKDEKFCKLVKSIENDPEFMAYRELLVYAVGEKYVIIGGEMRYRAMKELKYTEAPCKVIAPETTPEQLKAYILKDNSGYGQWDYDILANEYNIELLEECDIELLDNSDFDIDSFFDGDADSDSAKNDYTKLTVMIPVDLSEKESEIKELLKATMLQYNGVIVK